MANNSEDVIDQKWLNERRSRQLLAWKPYICQTDEPEEGETGLIDLGCDGLDLDDGDLVHVDL